MGKVRIKVLVSVCIILLVASIFKITDVVAEYDDVTTDNVYIGYFVGDRKLETMPEKNDSEGLIFNHGECNNGVTVEWNEDRWAPLIIGLNQNYTKCSLYFSKVIELDKDVPIVTSGNGLYEVKHDDLEELDSVWNKTEYRYAGSNPNNYVKFNNEIWRIIGLVNVKTNNGIEQRIKIIRTNNITGQKDFGNYSWDTKIAGVGSSTSEYGSNDWTDSQLKDMLNGIYYNSEIGNCYQGDSAPIQCDFSGNGNLPKGLDEKARNMIDSDVIWNLGGWTSSNIIANEFYEKERGINIFENRKTEWSKNTDVGGKCNGIGLIYPSDYAYGVGGKVRDNCLTKNLYEYDVEGCSQDDWLVNVSNTQWTLTPGFSTSYRVFNLYSNGSIRSYYANNSLTVLPTLYLKSNIKLVDGTGSIDSPYELLLN